MRRELSDDACERVPPISSCMTTITSACECNHTNLKQNWFIVDVYLHRVRCAGGKDVHADWRVLALVLQLPIQH